MYNGWGSIYWDSSVGDTAAWGLYLQQVGVADQPLVDEFTTNYIVGGDELCLAPNFDNYTSEMGAISGITSPSQGSAVFNGTSDYISLGNVLNQGTDNATYSFWVYRSASSANHPILVKSNGGALGANYGFLIAFNTSAQLNYYTADDDNDQHRSAIAYSNSFVNEWHHIAIVVDKSQTACSMYLDGSAQNVSGSLGNLSSVDNVTNTLDLCIGSESDNSYFMDGNLANVAVWNRALSSDEINSVMWKQYQDLNTAEISGLKAWYSLDSTEVFDWYGYARNQGAVVEGTTCVNNALNALAQL